MTTRTPNMDLLMSSARRLDAELRGLPWFVSVGVMNGSEFGLQVYVTELMPKNTKAVGDSFEGWNLEFVVAGHPMAGLAVTWKTSLNRDTKTPTSKEEEMLAWIEEASYEELLQKWRFEPGGSPWFVGEMGVYYQQAMTNRKNELSHEEQVVTSKKVGWDR